MLLVPFLTTRLDKQRSLCGGEMIRLLLAQQKLSEKLCMGLVTSLLLSSDPCCCILHSTQGKRSNLPVSKSLLRVHLPTASR